MENNLSYFTEKYFQGITANITESVSRYFSRSKNLIVDSTFDVFLSYNIQDIDVVLGIYYLLRKKRLTVYLDYIVDPELKRDNCNLVTAKLIRTRLENCRSIIYASSLGASESKWMSWELGVVDGHTKRGFILPVSNDYKKDFEQKEYLQLYPIILKDEGVNWKIKNADGTIANFHI